MDNKIDITLNKGKSTLSTNVENNVAIEVETEQKLLPNSSTQSTIDAYEQYLEESDSSDKYRLIFTINPVCTNVLFNHITELVKNSGGKDCKLIRKADDIKNTVFYTYKFREWDRDNIQKCEFTTRDTSITNEVMGNDAHYDLKCGIDIFNNHLLRKKEFVLVNKITNSKSINPRNFKFRYFNTLFDIQRDSLGNNDSAVIDEANTGQTTSAHIYNMDNQMSFNEAITANLKEKDGWFGFTNQANLGIINYSGDGKTAKINRVINNRKECDFINLYPDKSLFSFVPKWNSYRSRSEKNWNYCITYPYRNNYENSLVSEKLSDATRIYGFKAVTDDKITIYSGGTSDFEAKNVLFRADINHNLKPGDDIEIDIVYSGDSTKNVLHCNNTFKVRATGNNGYDSNHYFSIAFNDIISEVLKLNSSKIKLNDCSLRIRKVVNGYPCKYYLRIFKCLPCFENTQYNVNDGVTEKEINDALTYNGFNNVINQLGFAKNAYGDDIAQILYNDDIVTTGLKDNLGRDLSEIYLTIVKNNAGYEEWYENNTYNNENIEYSHCFGEVTSGFDLPTYYNDYNVHKLHNIKTGTTADLKIFPKASQPIESDITISGTTTSGTRNYEFVGDIVELDEYTLNETVLEKCYHRFNTAQRETLNNEFSALTIDSIISDDYMSGGFESGTTVNSMNCYGVYYRANLAPEGYYYQAHYPIRIREYDDTIQEGYHTAMGFVSGTTVERDKQFICVTDKNYFMNLNNEVYLYDKKSNEKFIGRIASVSGDDFREITITMPNSISGKKIFDYYVYKPNILKPRTAYELENGTGRYIWREFTKTANITQDSELYNATFTNGAHYFHKNINFFLRRQDPYGEYSLAPNKNNYGKDYCITNLYGNLEIYGNAKDVTEGQFFEENANNNC